MNNKRLHKYLLQLCVCVIACAYAALTLAAEPIDANMAAALKGRWEGTLTGAFRTQEVSWHFELDDDGGLKGYMGPASAGMPRLRMEELSINGTTLSFRIRAQHAAFSGNIGPDGVDGSWQQGGTLPLQMRKKHFEFPLAESIRSELAGRWRAGSERNFIQLDFVQREGGGIEGFLSSRASDLNEVPLVDIFVTEEGFAQFATDNERRFTGRLVNGVLVGEYVSNGRRSLRTFVRVDLPEREYDLGLSETALQRLRGRWHYKVWGDDIVLEVTGNGTSSRGQLLFDEGPNRSDPLLELTMNGDNVGFTTFSGRTFNGSFTAEGIAGEYRVNARPYGVLFTRQP